MAGSKTSPTITGRGAENNPQPPTPNVATKDRFRFRSLISKNKNPTNGSASASNSVTTLTGNAAPGSSSAVPVTTPNPNSGLDTFATATEAPISELWNEAWDELRKNTALFEDYEKRLTASSSSVGLPSFEKCERAQMMKVLLEKKIDELESGQWKIGFQNNQFAVKDLIEPVVGVIDWAKEYIGKAAQASPYSSVAWAGVCLLLPLVLNPGEQEAARAKCLEGIAALLRQCSIREALYRNSYDDNTERKEANLTVHISYREELKILYVKILTFQATCLCHLSYRTGGRIIRDMAIWTDWDELSTAIDVQKERMGEIETQWRDFKLQDQWNKEKKRHSEHMNYLDPMSNEIRRIREVTEKAQNDKFRLGLLQWLSSEDFSARYNDIWSRHEESTGDWLIENNRYHDWKKKQSSFLWLYGKAGSGKSYLSAPAIHSLTGSCENSPYKALAYYYFSFTEQPEQDASRMLSSMIRQLCGARPDSPAWLNNLGSTFRDKGARPTLEHLEGALWNAVEGFNAVYLIIDALDECTTSKSTRATLMKSLVKLQKCSPPNVHILVTSRKEPDIEAALDRMPLASEEKIDLFEFRDAVNHDMDIYLQQKLDSPEFDNMSDDTKTLARSLLLEKADGMFQYVALQLIEIENSLGEDIPKLLANLPQGLDETYIRMLKSIDSRYYPIVYRILLWIAMSKEPLSPKMLAEAAVIDPRAESPFDPRKRMKGLEKPKGLLKLLPGLLREEEQVRRGNVGYRLWIKFSHFSVQEFLFSTNLRLNPIEEVSRYALHKDEANHFMAESCICYHLYASQVKDVTKDNYQKLFPIWKYANSYWAEHMEDLDEELWTLPLKEKVLLALKPNTDSFLSMIRMCHIGLTYSYHPSINPDPYSANPVYYISANRYQRVLSFYLKELDTKQLDAQINCQLIKAPGSFGSPLQAAAYHGGDKIIKLLIQRGADVNAQGGYFGNALQAAASLGQQEEIVMLLLEHGADVNAQGGHYHTALLAALHGNSEEIVELLISQGADINAQGRYGETALHAAACSSSEKVIRLLLELGANVNGQGGYHGNALQAAACRGREEIVRLLLEYGADVNAQDGGYGNALEGAAMGRQSGSEEMVKLLLKLGADVNAQGGMYGNALQGAASSGNKGIVKLLIELGANVNAQGGKFDTALQAAAACRQEGVAKLLLQRGADVKCQGGLYGNALQAAARDGSEKLVKLFLEHGADVNAQGGKYGTALQAAASSYWASVEIVKLLLEKGADVNAKGGEYGNALQGAASGGLVDIIKLMLEHGADINAEGGHLGSALQAAATTGSEDIVKLLLDHGANVNAQGGFYGTALQAAASPSPYGSEEVVKLLLEHGADVNAKGGKYGSALKAAQNCYEDDIMDLLLAHGAAEQ
ncbi:hypothetical protein VE01_05117 [Pseudogymnoascus verrucosus]|uniref:NACHT domain-containing protein n=1 Tax=Pseudogymnoascus verrucosus TaxID=342668 RepID=A0A1B8GPM1_9PEZI|nr:uncharacterized protein VE01_05117 [Pseudogymnoascus verrucosus]OBT97761.1 hypothetical protein VE01_05117 [Pseudogymnoascus verrucosus]